MAGKKRIYREKERKEIEGKKQKGNVLHISMKHITHDDLLKHCAS